MDPKIWGPKFWFALHTITFNYSVNPDEEEKERVRNFFNSLEYILPCKLCRVNYSHHIRQNPIENKLNSRKDLVFWLIDIHNMVNVQNNKPKLSYEQVITIYEKAYNKKIDLYTESNSKCSTSNNNLSSNSSFDTSISTNNNSNNNLICPNYLHLILLIILIIAIIILFFIIQNNKKIKIFKK
jgi:ATP-dependent Zn protease